MVTVLEIVAAVVYIAVGFAIGYLISTLRNQRELIHKDAEIKGTEAMEDRFKVLAAEALKENRNQFNELTKPISESLEKLDKASREMEKERAGAYFGLVEQVTELKNQTEKLSESSTTLSTALRGSSKARGEWGQIALKNLIETAGMTEHCDFEVEVTLASGKGGARVDVLVHIPDGGSIPIDSKVPLAAYWDALKFDDPKERNTKMIEHAKAVKAHVDDLVRRDYSSLIKDGGGFTVLYIPAEPLLAAAFEHDPTLQEYAFARKVLVATPVTLLALLYTVGVYWRNQSIVENAQEIATVAREFWGRVAKFSGDLAKVGRGLSTALSAYNSAVGSFDRRVVPGGRRLEELKVVAAIGPKKIVEPKALPDPPRTIQNLLEPDDSVDEK